MRAPWHGTGPRAAVLALGCALALGACGQAPVTPMTAPLLQQGDKMDTNRITNPTAKTAFEAWQANDLQKWLSCFASGAVLYDDGKPRDLGKFSTDIGKERFLSIDVVENEGKDIFGRFHSDRWGEFKTYFKFTLDAQGKIARLDIGQASY